ncbi:MAG: AAA family ATPase [Paludibacteraceae bacterium]|nr:AAA family ATPase [Paludibacteraceae bacterium]
MEQVITREMSSLGFTEKVGDIFIDWETVKDELLEPDRKAGTGNGTIHVFLGKEGYRLLKNLYPEYLNQVNVTNDTNSNAPIITHVFSKANLISSIGHVCNYYIQKGDTEKLIDLVAKVAAKLNETSDKFFTSKSLFKWSLGSNDLRPYFKQFDDKFQKTIRPLLLPNSAYKISLFKNKNGEVAAFWLIGFEGLTTFEANSTISYLHNVQDQCICQAKKLASFILMCIEYFNELDNLKSIVPYAAVVPVNNPIKVSKESVFLLTGMFIETDINEIKRRNENHHRWFEKAFSLGEKEVYLSTQWNSEGNYQLTLSDFEKLIKECYGSNYYYKQGQDGVHELWITNSGTSTDRTSDSLQQIFYGAPGTGKSNTIKREVEGKGKIHFRTTFHPDSDYSTFVGCYKPTMVEAPVRDGSGHEVKDAKQEEKNRISYSFVPQAFLKAYCEAWNKLGEGNNEPVYLIIEEINRGNCAQIFGDLFQLLDRKDDGYSDYPIDADEDLKRFLKQGTKEDGTKWLINEDGIKNGKLCLPPNLYIWATMNTSDQSLFPIDSAFKRRWEWKYMPISNADENWKISVNGVKYDWWSFVKKINEKIDGVTHSEDKKLGYFFCKAENKIISADKFVGKVLFYIYNDVFKDYGFDYPFFKDANDNDSVLTFQSFFLPDGTPNEEKVAVFMTNLGVEVTPEI